MVIPKKANDMSGKSATKQHEEAAVAVASEADPLIPCSSGLQQSDGDDAAIRGTRGAAFWECIQEIRGLWKSLAVMVPAIVSGGIYLIFHRSPDNPYMPVVPYRGDIVFLAERYHGGARLRIFPNETCGTKADCLAVAERQPAAGEPDGEPDQNDSDAAASWFGYWPGDGASLGETVDGSVLLAVDSVALVARPSTGSVEIWRTLLGKEGEDQLFVGDNVGDSGDERDIVATLPRPKVWSRVDADVNPYLAYAVTVELPRPSEFFGLGQIGWNRGQSSRNALAPPDSGPLKMESTPDVDPFPIDLARNNRTWPLRSAKYWAAVPFGFTADGLGVVWNMPGYGNVSIQESGSHTWTASHALLADLWFSDGGRMVEKSSSTPGESATRVLSAYNTAFGAPPVPERTTAKLWQSTKRYRTSAEIKWNVDKYKAAGLGDDVGVWVVDNGNEGKNLWCGEFRPQPICYGGDGIKRAGEPPYPPLKDLTSYVANNSNNAQVMFSVFPSIGKPSRSYKDLKALGCLGGRYTLTVENLGYYFSALNNTWEKCGSVVEEKWLGPGFIEQGVRSFFLDETDGVNVAPATGYHQVCGAPEFCGRTWLNNWIDVFLKPVRARGETPLALVRSWWLGTAKRGAVLWSSDVQCTFEELRASISVGLSAGISGIAWWGTDIGGFGGFTGCPQNDSPYMQELIIRWYQFGALTPLFRNHGCRSGPPAYLPNATEVVDDCKYGQAFVKYNGIPHFAGDSPPFWGSCGENDAWAYGELGDEFGDDAGRNVSAFIISSIKLRTAILDDVMVAAEEAHNEGLPLMRPLWLAFPGDPVTFERRVDLDKTQYAFGPGSKYMVAPVVNQGERSRSVYFPSTCDTWTSHWDSGETHPGGADAMVPAPLSRIPLFVCQNGTSDGM